MTILVGTLEVLNVLVTLLLNDARYICMLSVTGMLHGFQITSQYSVVPL